MRPRLNCRLFLCHPRSGRRIDRSAAAGRRRNVGRGKTELSGRPGRQIGPTEIGSLRCQGGQRTAARRRQDAREEAGRGKRELSGCQGGRQDPGRSGPCGANAVKGRTARRWQDAAKGQEGKDGAFVAQGGKESRDGLLAMRGRSKDRPPASAPGGCRAAGNVRGNTDVRAYPLQGVEGPVPCNAGTVDGRMIVVGGSE